MFQNITQTNDSELTRMALSCSIKEISIIKENNIKKVMVIFSARFMASLLSNIVNNLAEGIYRTKCKYGHDNKKCEISRINYKNCECFYEYTNFKDNLIKYKCLFCNKNYQKVL